MATRRLELGFTGGGVTQVTINEEAAAALTSTLGSGSGWTYTPMSGPPALAI